MKKSLFLMGLAVAAFTACTNEETIEVTDSQMLSFNGAFVGKATKAVTDVTTETIKEFYVYGGSSTEQTMFNAEKVYESGTPNTWIYDNLKTWTASETWKFAAYSNGGVATATTTSTVNFDYTNEELEITDYNCATEQKDLVVAIAGNASALESSNVPVEFTFKHALSMIKFTIQSDLGDGDNAITISDFKVNGVNGTGDLTYSSATTTWANVDTPADLSNAAEFTTTSSAAGESDQFVVIPQSNVSLNVTFTATLDNEEDVNVTKNLQATIADQSWTEGYRYNYIATITGANMDIITFADPVVTAWDDSNWSMEGGVDAGDLTNQ